jgi:hypothetical protein
MLLIGRCDGVYPGRVQSDTVAVLVLVGTTEQHFTIPSSGYVAVFSSTGNFYVLTNGQTAAAPAATSTSFPSPNTVPELNPTVLSVVPGNLMSVVGAASCTVTISFYQDTSHLDFQSTPLIVNPS